MKIKFLIVLLCLFIAGCTATQHLQPADADLLVAQQRVPGITLNDLQAGYKIYITKCSACHRLHNPNEYTDEKWRPILAVMFTKAKLSDESQKLLITNYVITKSK